MCTSEANVSKYFNDITVVFNNQISTGLLLPRTHGCRHSLTRCFIVWQNRQANLFSDLKLCAAVPIKWLYRKNLSPSFRYDLVQLEGNLCYLSLKKGKVSSTNLWDKLLFVNSVKLLVFDLMKISFLKRVISVSLTDIPLQQEEYEVIYEVISVLCYDKLALHFCHKIKQSYPTQTQQDVA